MEYRVSCDCGSELVVRQSMAGLGSYCDGRRNVVVVFPELSDFDNYLYAVDP